MTNKKKKPSTDSSKELAKLFPRTKTTPLAVKRSCEFWLDVFTDAMGDLLSTSHTENRYVTDLSPFAATRLTNDARDIADAALSEFESRWPGILIP